MKMKHVGGTKATYSCDRHREAVAEDVGAK